MCTSLTAPQGALANSFTTANQLNGNGLAFNPVTNYLFVSSTGTDEVLQYGGTSLQATVALGFFVGDFAAIVDPTELAFDSGGNMYVSIGNADGTQKGMVVEYTLSGSGNNVVATYKATVVDPETVAFTSNPAAGQHPGERSDQYRVRSTWRSRGQPGRPRRC